MLAYVSWHRPKPGVEQGSYEHALERFHRSLAHRRPSGLAASAAFRVPELPWLAPDSGREGAPQGYEDWYLLDSWSSVGVLEEAAVGRGHISAHDAVASRSAIVLAGIYRLAEGRARFDGVRLSVWVSPGRGHEQPTLADLLGDGMDRARSGLWRRCIALGPAPEYCLLSPEPPAGVAATRLPRGWSATSCPKVELWQG